MFAYPVCMEGNENNIAERCRNNLKLDEVLGYINGFLDVEEAVDKLNVIVSKGLTIDIMNLR
jgi:hypothetical protein